MADLAVVALMVGGFWGFSQATNPLPQHHFPSGSEAETCGGCHPQQFEQWTNSRHAQAWNNGVFQHGFEREPRMFCVHCHAPTATNPYELRRAGSKVQDEGVSCRVCHVRNGNIVSAQTETSPHPTVARPELATSEFCANCHEFNFVENSPDGQKVTDLVMQTTYTEWLSYRDTGGEMSCQGCHMPDGDHSFAGVHRPRPVIDGLAVACTKEQVRITNTGAGHAIPTGDVFREVKIESRSQDGMWSNLYSFRKVYAIEIVDGEARKYIAEDARLWPGRTAEIGLSQDVTGLRIRMQYSPRKSRLIANYTMASDGTCVTTQISDSAYNSMVKEIPKR